MARKLKYGHRQSVLERQHRFLDNASSIDKELDDAFQNVNWKRRTKAEKSLADWVKTYCIGLLLDDPPPDKGNQILRDMQKSISSHTNYMICMPRGQGKSSYVECTTLYALATGQQKYVVIVSNNARAAGSLMSDIWRAIQEPETPFATDYPEVCLPFQLCKGSFRRRQLYKGRTTDIQKNSCNIVLARLTDKDGKDLPTSSSIITTRGISSGLRGMKHGTQRPSLVLLDDLQDSETAENAEQVEKMLSIIRKDIMNLGGKERLSILQTGTPIQPEDLIDRIKNDPNWKTTMYKGIIKFPTNMDLWKRYFEIYDTESVNDQDHIESLEFYKSNRDKMDEGSEVFNPRRFSAKDGHISAIQKLLEIQHVIGKSAFAAEYQMQPVKSSYALDLSPNVVVTRTNKFKELEVPDGFIFTCGAIDLNTSYGATVALVAFKTDTTSIVVWHDIVPMKIDQKLPDTQYNAKVFDRLTQICQRISRLGVRIDGLAIDCGGRQWDAVNEFAKQSVKTVGIPACAFAGRSSTQFNPFVRTRLRDAIGRTVLCGNAEEHVKNGAGQKYVFFDADFYKEVAQRAFLSQVGASGSCSLYEGTKDEHTEFAIQVCNERLRFVQHRAGRDFYTWATKEPHDYLDCMAMCHAVAASQGMTGINFTGSSSVRELPNARTRRRAKPKIKVI